MIKYLVNFLNNTKLQMAVLVTATIIMFGTYLDMFFNMLCPKIEKFEAHAKNVHYEITMTD